MSKQAYPLSWPDGWKRASHRRDGQFKNYRQRLTVFQALERLLSELGYMGIGRDDIVISTNIPVRLDGLPRGDARKPSDPGAAVYWQKRGQSMRCMAIDRYNEVADNIAAIAATLEAMRAIERHGGAAILDRAFLGFAALPERASTPWRDVLGLGGTVNLDQVEERFRALIKVHHPDKGGDETRFREINQAREAARLELAS